VGTTPEHLVVSLLPLTEAEFDEQMLSLFDSLRVESNEFRDEFREGLQQMTNDDLRLARFRDDEVKQAHTRIIEQQERLLTLRFVRRDRRRNRSPGKQRSYETRQPIFVFIWKLPTEAETKSSTSQSKRLNFRKTCEPNGLRRTTLRSVESSKSSV
jgi:hypothetical protein